MYNVQLEKFCREFELGELISSFLFPKGMSNRTYYVETNVGKFVIKALSPHCSGNESKRNSLEASESIAKIIEDNGIPAISAKEIQGRLLNELEGQWYMVFDFFDGNMYLHQEITIENCRQVGKTLAQMHTIDSYKQLDRRYRIRNYNYGPKKSESKNWKKIHKKLENRERKPTWLPNFNEQMDDINAMHRIGAEAFEKFIQWDKVIAHGDIFNQNLLWKNDQPYIIDWEKSGTIDATYDVLHSALRMATEKPDKLESSINKEKLYAFFEGYLTIREININQLERVLHIIWHRRLHFLYVALHKYMKPYDKVEKKRSSKKVANILSLIKCYKAFECELDDLKAFIINQQPNRHKMRNKMRRNIRYIQNYVKFTIESKKRGESL